MSRAMRQRVLCHMPTTKGADQPTHPHILISAFVVPCLVIVMFGFCNQNFKPHASYCSWAGWFESDLVGNSQRHVFSWWGSYVLYYLGSKQERILSNCANALADLCLCFSPYGKKNGFVMMLLKYGKHCTMCCSSSKFWVHLHMSFITRKPVFVVCNQVRLKLACLATETS